MGWKLLTALVCAYGFLKEFRPSEAYLVAYLMGPWKNLTAEQVDNEIFPIWTYAYLVWLCPVFLLTDYLRYQPMLVLQGAAYIGTWSLLLWGQGVLAFKFVEVLYGLVTATDVAYYSYLFAMVTSDHFHIITSLTRAAALFGMCGSYLAGQLLVSFDLLDYFQLNIVSMVSVSLAFLIALFLPRPKYSDIFNRHHSQDESHDNPTFQKDKDSDPNNEGEKEDTKQSIGIIDERNATNTSNDANRSIREGLNFLWMELKIVYSCPSVVTWSVWWALASCGNLQVQNYIQNLWQAVAPPDDTNVTYNGAVEAVSTLVSALSVLAVSVVPINWSRTGVSEATMAFVCALNVADLVVMGTANNIWAAYVLYCVFRTTYQTVIALATLQVARSLSRQRYGFVFGVNMFFALLVETVMTVVVVDKAGLGVDIRTQFIVYGGYFGVLSVLFVVVAVIVVCRKRRALPLSAP